MKVLETEREILRKAAAFFASGDRADPVTRFRFVEQEKARYPVRILCAALGVSPSGYYAWRSRGPSARERSDAELAAEIRRSHARSRGTYGVPRVHADLAEAGHHVCRKRVARLMARDHLAGVHRRRFVRTTIRDEDAEPFPDLVDRDFTASGPDRLWVADITQLPTRSGPLLPRLDRRRLEPPGRRLDHGDPHAGRARHRGPRRGDRPPPSARTASSTTPTTAPIHEPRVRRRLRESGIAASMGSVGDCYDNAMAESFFATLETELIDRSTGRPPPRRRPRSSSTSRSSTTGSAVTAASATSVPSSSRSAIVRVRPPRPCDASPSTKPGQLQRPAGDLLLRSRVPSSPAGTPPECRRSRYAGAVDAVVLARA